MEADWNFSALRILLILLNIIPITLRLCDLLDGDFAISTEGSPLGANGEILLLQSSKIYFSVEFWCAGSSTHVTIPEKCNSLVYSEGNSAHVTKANHWCPGFSAHVTNANHWSVDPSKKKKITVYGAKIWGRSGT